MRHASLIGCAPGAVESLPATLAGVRRHREQPSRTVARRVPLPSVRVILGCLGCVFWGCFFWGCSFWGPTFVDAERFESSEELHRIAVLPFSAASGLRRDARDETDDASDVAELVTRFVSEALARRVDVIPANDARIALESQGSPVGRRPPELFALLAAKEFGADAILLGEVFRYRERVGSAAGSTRPASVEFEVRLHAAPSGAKLWVARFSYTQISLTGDPVASVQLPGGGLRFVTAAELARFGAERVADDLPLGP